MSLPWDDAETMKRDILLAVQSAAEASYDPVGVVLHPIHAGLIRSNSIVDPVERKRAQMAVADAHGVAYWTLGIEGFPPPLRIRLRRIPSRVRQRLRKAVLALPGVHGYYPDYGWSHPPRFARGRWWVAVGQTRFGWGEDGWW